jgi:hypothetical protein
MVKRQGHTLVVASLAAALACVTGCAQVLGLDSYGAATEDAGADATVDAIGTDATTDAGAAEGGDADAVSSSDSAATPDGTDAQSADSATDTYETPDVAPYDAAGCGAGAACAPPVPNGWTGPLVLWEGSGTAQSCATGFAPAFSGGASVSMPPAQCTCNCGSPTGVTCGAPTLMFDKNCHNMKCGMVSVPQGACTNLAPFDSTCGATFGVNVGGSSASGGSCASDASASVPQWSWGSLAVACSPSTLPGVSCGTGGQCMPAPSSPFEGHICVLQQGAGGCPAGDYSMPRVYYGTAQDTRGCSACSCGSPPTGVDCAGNAQVVLWETSDCDGGASQLVSPLPSGCVMPGFKMQGATFSTTPANGGCTPLGGQPTGSVAPQSPVTICCTP